MGHKITEFKSLRIGSGRYLYFEKPRKELWQGDTEGEVHESILTSSHRPVRELAVAGDMNVDADGMIIINGRGSGTLKFPNRVTSRVLKFLKQLPGVNADLVDST